MRFRPALLISAFAFDHGDVAITVAPAFQSEQLAATCLCFHLPSNPEVVIPLLLS